jgi:hypothetical protein
LESDYEEIFTERDKRLEKIDSEYADVRKATWDAFKNTDLLFTTFIMSPSSFLTYKFFEKAPKSALKTLKFIGGPVTKDVLSQFAQWYEQAHEALLRSAEEGLLARHESVVREDDEKTGSEKPKVTQKEVQENYSKLVQKVLDTSRARRMRSEALQALKTTLDATYSHAKDAMDRVKTVDDLDKLSKGALKKELEKTSKETDDQEVLKGIEQALIQSAKNKIKETYLKMATDSLKKDLSMGIPESHPYVDMAKKNIDRIKAL